MTIDEDTLSKLFKAGGAAVGYNCPMGQARAAEIAAFVAEHASSVMDLGCGHGTLAVEAATLQPALAIVGVDSDVDAIESGRALASERDVSDRVRFEVGDVTEVAEPAEAVLSIGAAYAFGTTAEAMSAMRQLGTSIAVVGDMVWASAPTSEHRDWFGDLPQGEDGLAELAMTAGWTVDERSLATLDEWDEFEHGWIDGVRAVGGPEADSFADERLTDYRSYRGVAGFGWVYLTR